MIGENMPSVPPAMFGHIGITVTDIEGAVEWYRDVLGFHLLSGPTTLVSDDSPNGAGARELWGEEFREVKIANMSTADGQGIELFEFLIPATVRQEDSFSYWRTGIGHFCIVGRDIDRLVARIEAAGGKRRTAIYEIVPGEPFRWCYCEDPFGVIIEVYTHTHDQVYANRGW
jgi:catechol 2,3-dioxygenase-like lactoylglutathione lyase family enzyme